MNRPISRRAFVQATAAGVAVIGSACGDDKVARPDADASPDTTALDSTTPDVSVDTEEVAPDTIEEVTPDVDSVDAIDDADSGPDPIGTFDPTAFTEAEADFLFGVQAGDPGRDGAILWTHYAKSTPIEVVVFEHGTDDRGGALYLREPVTPSATGFVHVEVDGLAPDTRYRFCFVVSPPGATPTQRSRIGHFRTVPAERTLRVVTFGGTSCVNQDYRPYRVLNRAAEAELDFFLVTGDAAYMDGAKTIDDYRDKWRLAFDTDGYRALFSSTGVFSTWDDHEVYDNWDPERVDANILSYAKTTYLEHMALRLDPAATGWKLWRSQRYGRTVEVFMLDCRSERLPSTRLTSNSLYLSRAQMDWLKKGLRDSPCVFKVIANTVPITDMPANYPSDKDRWEGYEQQRHEILSHIAGPPGVPGVLWLSGDFHFGSVAMVDPPGGKFADQWEIFMGQGANMPNPAWPALEGVPQFTFVTGENNYVKFVCDPIAQPPTITATFIDGDGAELYQQVFQLGAVAPVEP